MFFLQILQLPVGFKLVLKQKLHHGSMQKDNDRNATLHLPQDITEHCSPALSQIWQNK